jgi:hypothetical protein
MGTKVLAGRYEIFERIGELVLCKLKQLYNSGGRVYVLH